MSGQIGTAADVMTAGVVVTAGDTAPVAFAARGMPAEQLTHIDTVEAGRARLASTFVYRSAISVDGDSAAAARP